jgi:D-alanyl-D-alanine dipeptidase
MVLVISILGVQPPQESPATEIGFVSLADHDADILIDLRYYSEHNFIGKRVMGYHAPKCILSMSAAEALAKVQQEVESRGLTLKVYDCYRPQRAVDHFVAWAKNLDDVRMKAEFFPGVAKIDLFEQGYIAAKSGHSLGSTVDLTLVALSADDSPAFVPGQILADCRAPQQERFSDNSLDMGTGYDCFDPLSHTANPNISLQQAHNRSLLKSVMETHGFVNYPKEWWHFTLKDEPYPDRYFDFPIE